MQYIALIPWLLFFSVYSLNIFIKLYEKNKDDLKIWFKNNFIKMFRIDMLILIIIFIYFIRYENNTVNIMLFFMINLYLFINCFYDELKSKNRKKIILKHLLPYLLVISIPILFYIFTGRFVTTCLIMFGYSFFAYIIVILIKKISVFFATIFKKKKKLIK